MVVSVSDKLLIAHRRLFAEDQSRFFSGVVDAVDGGLVRLTGHSWARDMVRGAIVRKPDQRTKIVPLMSGSLLVYRLPASTRMGSLTFAEDGNRHLVLSDGLELAMDLTDRVH